MIIHNFFFLLFFKKSRKIISTKYEQPLTLKSMQIIYNYKKENQHELF